MKTDIINYRIKYNIPTDWDVDHIENALECIIDYRGKTPRKTKSGIPLITAKVINNGRIETPHEFISIEDYPKWMIRGLPQKGDVVLTTEAPIGKVAQINNDQIALAQRIITLRGRINRLNNKFLCYLLQTNILQKALLSKESGTTVKGIKQKEFRNIVIQIPSISEQKAIALILSTIQEAKEKTEAVIQATKELKKSMMKHLFTYGPVPVDEVDKVKLKETEIGVMPEGWELKTIEESVDSIEYGYSISIPNNSDPNGIPIISTADINRDDILLYNKVRKITPPKNITERLQLADGDILFNWRNSPELIGKTAIYKKQKENYTYASFILRIRCDEVKSHNYYLKYLFRYYRDKGVFLTLARRAVNQANYNRNEINVLKIPMPTFNEQKYISNSLLSVDEKIASEIAKLNAIDSIFKSVLDSLMTGKIRVGNQ